MRIHYMVCLGLCECVRVHGPLTIEEICSNGVRHKHVRGEQLVDFGVLPLWEEVQNVLVHHI